MQKKVQKIMMNELWDIYKNTDYSTYDLNIYYNPEEHIVLVPKPVFALAIADNDVRAWMEEQIQSVPEDHINVMVA